MNRVVRCSLAIIGALVGIASAHADELRGHALPFSVLRVVGNPMFQDGMVGGFIDVTVAPGATPGDWVATAVKIAEASITNGITFAEINVLHSAPPDVGPPLAALELARAYYAPIPGRSPWHAEWGITVAPYEGTPPEIYESAAYATAMGQYERQITDPNKLDAFARRKALSMARAKYKLPGNWRPRDLDGVSGPELDRSAIEIAPGTDISASIAQLTACLNKPRPTPMRTWGCSPD